MSGSTIAETAIALLAAGRASRFGGGKLDAPCAGKPLGLWAVEAAERAGFERRLIVVPEPAPRFAQTLEGWTAIPNRDAAEGIAASIRHAVAAAGGARRLVIALADMPLVAPDHLHALATGNGSLFTTYPTGRAGVPAAFDASAWPALSAVTGDRGAASAFPGAPAITVDPATLIDVDSAADLAEAERRLR